MTKPKGSPPPVKHVPQRTCIACRKTGAKRELVRLVSLPEGRVQLDLTGRKSGRGVYLCHSRDCWESALKTGRLEHALRAGIKPEDRLELENYAKGINNTSS